MAIEECFSRAFETSLEASFAAMRWKKVVWKKLSDSKEVLIFPISWNSHIIMKDFTFALINSSIVSFI